MASGINGPGNFDDNLAISDDNTIQGDVTHLPSNVESTPVLFSSTPNPVTERDECVQGQFYVGSDDEYEPEHEEGDLLFSANAPTSTVVSGNHLSFADLMAHQHQEDVLPATDARRMASSYTPVGERSTNMTSDVYNPLLHMNMSLNEEMEKVFEDAPSSEPPQLRMDFSNPAIASEAGYVTDEKFGEHDFQSHRRSNVHMYQPMSTHLSSRDLKTIETAQGAGTTKEKSMKRRRRRSSSSGSSSSTTKKAGIPTLPKSKKKSRKQPKTKRKPLASKMGVQPSIIPEENEEESDEESDDEDEDDNKDQDDDDVDKDRDASDGNEDDENREEERIQEQDSRSNEPSHESKENRSESGGGKLVFIQETGRSQTKDDVAVLYNARNDAPKPTADDRDSRDKLVDQPKSYTSLRSSSCSSCAVSENEEKDKLRSLVNLKEHAEQQKKKHHKRHHHHHHKKKNKGVKVQRRMSGHKLKEMDEKKASKMSADAEDLEKEDLEDIHSHRYDQHMGVRKHLLHRPVKQKKIRTALAEKKVPDRKPHEIFVELDELVQGEWRETARWIKFEEDIEESQMWGKPRVASLSFHSLLELRKTIEKGAVMMDLEKNNLTDISNAVVEELVKTGQIRAEDQGTVLRMLLSKRRHKDLETGLQYNLSKASFSNFFTSQSYASRLNAAANAIELDGAKPLLHQEGSDLEKGRTAETRSETPPQITFSGGPTAKDIKIMKKIPEGAEASAVLVGHLEHLEQPAMAFVRLAEGTELENMVALPIPVRFLFVLLGPSKPDYDYHEIGRSISTLMADQEFRVMAYAAEGRQHILRAINEFLDDSIVLPPGQLENPDLLKNISKYQSILAQRAKKKKLRELQEKKGESPPPPEEDPLRRTKRCFGGLINDVKRRYPKYLSDITDAFNLQCFASIIFIYFAALSPAVTFGGLMGEITENWIGVSEMLLGCCIGGCTFGLLSGQPLLVVGSTGPLIVFEEAVFKFCQGSDLPYLATRVWIGLWITLICMVVVAFEGSFLVRFISRFTQEIFAVLISLIFIFETFRKLAKTFLEHPLLPEYPINETAFIITHNCSVESGNETYSGYNVTGNFTYDSSAGSNLMLNQPNTALLSTLLMFGTFIIAYFLRQFKNSKFFRSSVRRSIGDFGVPIAITIMLVLDILIQDVYTQKLNVPKGISPTDPEKRGWLINPFGPSGDSIPVWIIFASAIPAFLVFILIFMESHITEVIVSAKERNLKKGTGFHLNLFVLGILNGALPILGMPWVCCAAVRSITHTNSLTIMSTTQAPGEKARIEGVREQRVTIFVVNACLGLSILMQPLLKEIPIAVLFGIFLYMGVTSLSGVQFVDRLEMLFMPAKHYPDFSYVKAVRAIRIHLFTFIETICLAILWAVKSTAAQIAFPFALVLTVPLRFFILPKIFTKKELRELDS